MKIKQVILPLLVLLVAIGLTFQMVKSRKLPKPQETQYLGPLVEFVELQQEDRRIVVSATGTARAVKEVQMASQVRGKVVWVSSSLVAGGRVDKGELLFRIEDVDYRLAIEQAKATLANAELELQRNKNLARVAWQEWQALNPEGPDPDPLVVYEPQIKSAMAQRDAAKASLEQAGINLKRTHVYAPLTGYVRNEQVEPGQYVNAGSPVATLVGTAQVEIVVPLPVDELTWLKVPADDRHMQGALAEIVLNTGQHVSRWQGQVTRVMGEIEPRNRMARIVVTVDEPVSKDNEANRLNRLLPGMFVEVNLQGQELSGVFAIPRGALHDDDAVWIIDDENKLQIHNVDIVRSERDEVLAFSGVSAGDRLVLTNLSAAAEGMVLRPQVREKKQ